ncbi:histone acetyltransferase [Lichenicola cladoniae]|uniref:Histone acetyltransferase n=1 Tax=Lichenicola cladoniae TaxID=1484109 RepID=A0A6M8HNK8_9PROT|nr:MSMEG_0567/Sll0786 family nitrogen starvation N-acetyltransferase [Lichenicola cladoniae]NPD67371.1 histone acetyltransferase [Acetobacteraceae bacterium]QKE89867.1 histone acetyltransferase [Lichenicola cladoniae]
MAMWDQPAAPFIPGQYCVRIAQAAWERDGHFRLRHEVFCDEQQVFSRTDRDAIDDDAILLVATTCVLGSPHSVVGAVRIHEDEPGSWRGSRLAVQADHRRVGRLGAELIRLAVCTAHQRGATRFLAQVQVQNVTLFERMNWRSLEQITVHGLPHHLMQADLAHYPPHGLVETRMVRPLAARAMAQAA